MGYNDYDELMKEISSYLKDFERIGNNIDEFIIK